MAQYSEYSIRGGSRGPWQTHGGWWWVEDPGGGRILQILHLYLSIDAARLGAGLFFLLQMTNRLFVLRGAPLAPGPAYQ